MKDKFKETSYDNLVKSPEKLEEIFQPFKTLHIGSYELFSLLSYEDEEGCSHHYIFIGM